MGKVLHASYSGYFPFCISKVDSVPTNAQGGTYYPVGLSLKQAVSLFWRVKSWTFQDPLTPLSPVFSLNTSRYGGQFYPPPENEESIVCVEGYRYDDIFGSSGQFSQIIDFDLFRPQERLLQVENLYYPRLFFNGQFINESIADFGAGLTFADAAFPYEVGSFTIYWLGYVASMKLYSGFEGIPYSASLTASEYWSYGGTYDTATGQPL